MNKLSLLLMTSMLLLFTACGEPSLSSEGVKKEYYTGGGLRSAFIPSDKTGQNGMLKQYGYNGKIT